MGQHQIYSGVPRLATVPLIKIVISTLSRLSDELSPAAAGSDSSDAKTGGLFFSGKHVVRRAMELADRVMFDSPDKRLKMPLCSDPSGDEEEEDEQMEVTCVQFCPKLLHSVS